MKTIWCIAIICYLLIYLFIVYSEGSSKPTKDAQVIRVRGMAAPRAF